MLFDDFGTGTTLIPSNSTGIHVERAEIGDRIADVVEIRVFSLFLAVLLVERCSIETCFI